MEEKWLLKSKTIWGAIIGFLPSIFTLFGVEFDPSVAGSAQVAGESLINSLFGVFDSFNEVVGAGLVVWGRLTAKTNLKIT
jgi:hypothetical protein